MWSSRRDSWPPTQVLLKPTVPTKENPLPSLDDIDEDPLTYFLTPAPDLEDDLDEAMMDFDAGIENDLQPRPFVRSVSPSTLDGLRKPGLRPVSPDTGSDITADDEDDDEDYIRFSPGKDSLLSLHDVFGEGSRPRSPAFNLSNNNGYLSPSSPQLRGRSRGHGPGRQHTLRRRPGQLWREPSPDVWSIEEETEEEMMSDVGSSVAAHSDNEEQSKKEGKKAKKPKKKVRFMLPATTH